MIEAEKMMNTCPMMTNPSLAGKSERGSPDQNSRTRNIDMKVDEEGVENDDEAVEEGEGRRRRKAARKAEGSAFLS